MKIFKNIVQTSAAFCILSLTILTGCKKDFFELKDTTGIDSRIWDDPGAVGLFLNRTYALVIPQWPVLGSIHNTSDEMNNANTAFLYGQLIENSVTDIGTSAGNNGNRYYDIRRCNVALAGLDTSTIPQATVRTFKGQFYFLRAMSYFRLVSLYGGVPLILQPTSSADDVDLNIPRSKTSECIAAIVNDLDSAAAMLPARWTTTSDIGRISRGAAMAFKGRVTLLWASPLFNPTNISTRWQEAYAANKAAHDRLVADGYGLIARYSDVFLTEDHREALIVRKYNTAKDLGHNIENQARPFSESSSGGGSYQPTWNLVQAYPTASGLPVTHPSSGYNASQFWLNRDPRFEASIAYNGSLWPLSGKTNRRQWTYVGVLEETRSTTGFWSKRFINPALTPVQSVYNSNSGGGNGIDWIEMRFAEVLVNLAECANETGRLSEAKDMIRLLRQRAGIVQGTFDYGLGVATDVVTMRTLLLNERQVEFALEGKRNYDLRRTRNLNLLSTRLEYRWTPKAPYFAGLRPANAPATNIYLDQPDAIGLRPKDTLNVNNPVTNNNAFTTGTFSIEGTNVVSVPDKYYFYPLPTFFTQYFHIQQTNGWINGTFDPLQ